MVRPHRIRIERSRGRLGTMGIVAKVCLRLTLSLGCGVRAESRLFACGTGGRGLCGAVASISGAGTEARAAPPTVAARTRIVSAAGIRLDQRKSVRSFKGIICADVSEIAVGTLITERPPHRSVRAQFGHTAPTLGV